jgi:hypothetical protein
MLAIGATGSGKSHFVLWTVRNIVASKGGKEKCRVYVFCSPLSIQQWYDCGIAAQEDIYDSWSKEIVGDMVDGVTAADNSVVILDDVYGLLNTNSDRELANLFKVIRHQQGQMIIACHGLTDVGPGIRKNVGHVLLTYQSSLTAIQDIGSQFLGGDWGRLRDQFRVTQSLDFDYCVVHIHRATGKLYIRRAPDLGTNEYDNPIVAVCGDSQRSTVASSIMAPQSVGVQPSMTGVAKNVSGTNVSYTDNSQSILRLEQNVAVQARLNSENRSNARASAELQHQLEYERVSHKLALQDMTDKEEARTLIYRARLSPQERSHLCSLLSRFLCDGSLTPSNMYSLSAPETFMSAFYPHDTYTNKNTTTHVTNMLTETASALSQGDSQVLVTNGIDIMASTSVGKRLINSFIRTASDTVNSRTHDLRDVRDVRDVEESARNAKKLEMRRLIITRNKHTDNDRRKMFALLQDICPRNEITAKNYLPIAFEFLREFYPTDFHLEREAFERNRRAKKRAKQIAVLAAEREQLEQKNHGGNYSIT